MTGTTTLICPKCHGEMRTYERNGVLVDQCEDCRGIFLDRGELERLIDAEHHVDGAHGSREHEHRHHDDHDDHDDHHNHHDGDDDDRYERERHGKRRAGPASFLQDFLGGGD